MATGAPGSSAASASPAERRSTERDWTEQLGAVVGVNAFGIDSDGELYLVSHDGAIRKLVPIR